MGAIAIEGGVGSFRHGHAAYPTKGYFDTRLMSAMSRGIVGNGGDFSATAKMGVVVAQDMRERYQGVFYGRAQNLPPVSRLHMIACRRTPISS